MASVEVKPSPEGVPGAVTDPRPGPARSSPSPAPGGTQVNGYLARPAAAGRAARAMIVIHEAGGPERAHPRRRQPLRQPRLRDARRGPVHARRRPAADGRPAGDDEAPVLDVRRDRARRPRGRRRPPARARGRERQGRLHRLLHGRPLHAAVRRARATGWTPPWTAGAASSTAPRPRSARRPSAPRRRSSSPSSCTARCSRRSARRTTTPRPSSASSCASARAASGQEVKVDVYEGAGHAFFADYRPTYRPEPAAKLWAEIVPFLDRELSLRLSLGASLRGPSYSAGAPASDKEG